MKNPSRTGDLLQSGIIFSAVSLLTGLLNYVFQGIIGRQLDHGEYGLVNTTLSYCGLLSLPIAIATTAVTHYIARFNIKGDDARLDGLLTGCRRFLLHLMAAGSVFAIIFVIPLSYFFHFPRWSLMLVALVYVLAALWYSYAIALCQGLAWFKRLALIGFLAAILRILVGWLATEFYPKAEGAVFASVVVLLATPVILVLFWKKDFPRRAEHAISPWTREFIRFLVVSAACIWGTYCFSQGDLLAAQRNFGGTNLGVFSAAGQLARALPIVVTPLLIVLFTHRSGQHHGDAVREQLKLLGLYAAGLIGGAIILFVLRNFCVKLIFGKPTPESAAMIGRFATTMVFVGLLQALGLWSLASRWIKLSLLYGGLGIAYWVTLMSLGKSPTDLLRVMPVAAGLAFGAVFLIWLVAMRLHKIGEPPQS